MKTYQSKELMRLLKEDGWYLNRVRGSHHQFKHSNKKGLVTIQHPVKDLSGFIVNSIFKQAGWK
ncbi:MAG: addiction module toxin, HicA family [Gammaproteobacteria bacterium RIFCSPHIGHO2_12_FULL_38_11]|nr:MAG: addiction module toxin, HicA family [Gammaproteobacteria bacterium RIFCSPHIGHO2_12_FULL_38_11]